MNWWNNYLEILRKEPKDRTRAEEEMLKIYILWEKLEHDYD